MTGTATWASGLFLPQVSEHKQVKRAGQSVDVNREETDRGPRRMRGKSVPDDEASTDEKKKHGDKGGFRSGVWGEAPTNFLIIKNGMKHMKYEWTAIMNIGGRGEQEDGFLINGEVVQEESAQKKETAERDFFTACVADGMGGHEAGEVVSRFILDEIKRSFSRNMVNEKGIKAGLKAIQYKTLEKKLSKDGGAALAGIFFLYNQAFCFNVGDCRIYCIEKETLTRVTKDHSFVERLVDKGFITEEEAFGHPHKNIVEFGVGPCFEKEWDKKEPFIKRVEVSCVARFLICSDGLSDVLTNTEIFNAVKDCPVADAPSLLDAVKEKKLKDNITFIILEVRP